MEPRYYLNDDDTFINGDWEEELLEDVASEVPEYLHFLLEQEDLLYTEREKITKALQDATIP